MTWISDSRHEKPTKPCPDCPGDGTGMCCKTTYSSRGFAQYLRGLPAGYGEKVSVYESSSASEPHVWLAIEGEAHLTGDPRPMAGISHGVAPGAVHAHLTVKQAVAVHDALGRWIAEEADA